MILECRLINLNKRNLLETDGVPTSLLSISTNMQHLDWITTTLMYFGSSCRIYKNGLILVGSEVWDLINSLQTSKLIKNLSSCGQKTRKLRFGPIDGHYSLPTVVGRMKRSCFLHILKWWGLGGWMWIGLCEVLGGDSNHSCRATSHPPASLYFLASIYARFLPK